MTERDARWQMYVVRCADGTLYCGVTTHVLRRLRQHNGQLGGGARYTRPRRPVALLARTGWLTRRAALRAERWFKQLDTAAKHRVLNLQVNKQGLIAVST